ncbi:MAG TPA: hypothetical protein VFW92_06110, partial [Candidatus Limnocylindrales bacterium]|nr:hypothetical protein [Candidatus Limnocylindrales bacterium]
MTTERRAVVLVGNPAAPYSRGLRIARLLAAGGFAVEIAAIAAAGLPEREEDGGIVIRRYRPRGPMARMTATYRDPATAGPRRRPPKFVGVPKRAAAALRRWAFWPHTVRGWWAALEAELPPADLYHACGSLTIAPALAARDRHASGPGGGPARVVYDAIDAVTESNNMLGLPAPVRRLIARRERGWARAADARITVNDPLARLLAARWGTARPAVVPNYPELRVRPEPGDRIRAALSLPASTRIVLFQGRLGPWLGIEEAERAILELPDTALVLLGFGRWEEQCRQRDTQPPFAGRHFTLPAVHPDALLAWTASADVSIIPLPAVSLNQRRSTPNKFWESLAAG